MRKKRLSAAQGTQAACILFELNSRAPAILGMARQALLPEEYLREPGAALLCDEWRAFIHAVVTAGLMQHAPNSVLLAYLRETGNLLALDDRVQARLAAVMALVISAVWDKLEQYEILAE